jgi:hypothetical protein
MNNSLEIVLDFIEDDSLKNAYKRVTNLQNEWDNQKQVLLRDFKTIQLFLRSAWLKVSELCMDIVGYILKSYQDILALIQEVGKLRLANAVDLFNRVTSIIDSLEDELKLKLEKAVYFMNDIAEVFDEYLDNTKSIELSPKNAFSLLFSWLFKREDYKKHFNPFWEGSELAKQVDKKWELGVWSSQQ